MWMFLIQIAITIILALLSPKPKVENARKQNLDAANFPRANESDPVPIIFGKVRLRAPNTIWYGDFVAKAKKGKKPGFVAKLFGAKRQIIGYKYYVGMDLALCMGPDVTLHTVYADKKIFYSGSISGSGSFSMKEKDEFQADCDFYSGAMTQSVNSYLASKTGGDAPAYNGVCHVVLKKAFIGESPQVPPLNFELSRYSNNLGLPSGHHMIGVDMNPAEIIYSILSDGLNGMNVKVNDLDVPSFLAVGERLFIEQNGASLVLTATSTGSEVIEELMRQIDGVMYQDASTGKVSIRLIRQDYDVDTLPHFNEDNIVVLQKFTRSSWVNTYNQIRVKYNRREKKYEEGVAAVQDLANITSQGRMLTLDLNFPTIYDTSLANKIASREMAQRGIPLFTMTFETNREAFGLKPGDPFIFSWAEYGIVSMIMRVNAIDLGKLQDNRIVVDAGQDEFATNLAIFGDPETGGSGVDFSTDGVVSPLVMEIPRILAKMNDELLAWNATSGEGFIAPLARSGSGGVQIGYTTEHSYDNFTTELAGLENPTDYPPSATLLTAITPTTNDISRIIPTVLLNNVDLRDDVLSNNSTSQIRDGNGLFICEEELMAYETITDNNNGTFTLTNVHRALLDTESGDHTTGTYLYFLNSPDHFVDGKFTSTEFKSRFRSVTPTGAQDATDTSVVVLTKTLDNRYVRPLPARNISVEITAVPSGVTGYTLNVPTRSSGQLVPAGATLKVHWKRRNYDSSVIQLFADADEAPEAGVTYTLKWTLNSSPTIVTGITGTFQSITLPFSVAGQLEIEITAVRGALTSFVKEYYFLEVET